MKAWQGKTGLPYAIPTYDIGNACQIMDRPDWPSGSQDIV